MEELNNSESQQSSGRINLGFWLAIGVAIGTGVGVATGQIAIGIGIGIAFGAGLSILTGKRTKTN